MVKLTEGLLRGDEDPWEVTTWVFNARDGTEVLRIDEHGMTYKGRRIEDAGEVYKAFLEAMRVISKSYSGK